MRILIDVPKEQVDALKSIAIQAGTSRAEIVRQALGSYLAGKRPRRSQYFGIWANNPETQDVQAYLDRIRDEWEERFPTEPKP